MARPSKQTVSWFPHYCSCATSKTMSVVEEEYGNDGYAFWFKLLETLGATDGHCLTVQTEADWRFLAARAKVKVETAKEIIHLLIVLEAIDPELWETANVIWCEKFVEGVSEAYRKRDSGIPLKPVSGAETRVSAPETRVSATGIPQKCNLTEFLPPETPQIDREIDKREREREGPPLPPETSFEQFWEVYPRKYRQSSALQQWMVYKHDGADLSVILRAAKNYAAYHAAKSTPEDKIHYPDNWLKETDVWEEFIEPKAIPERRNYDSRPGVSPENRGKQENVRLWKPPEQPMTLEEIETSLRLQHVVTDDENAKPAMRERGLKRIAELEVLKNALE